MKRSFLNIVMTAAFGIAVSGAYAQTTALDFNTEDCAGNPTSLYADLDAGKAVVLFYFMPSCGSCPPPAQKIQAMANNINAAHPGMVKAYAFPFNNTTNCAYTQTWVTSNSLSLYTPMDSGATAVAHYGGFGMPTVVLVGGNDHRVLFSTLSFSTSDTTIMRDSILSLLGATGIEQLPDPINNLNIYPNPASGKVNISLNLIAQSDLVIDVVDVMGKQVALVSKEKNAKGAVVKTFFTSALANGIYTVRITANGKTVNRKLNVVH
jgi:thiol-disulfide isomerase/thioredoxin